jgi:7,8-dihydro-6-hydroxymethylpterin-pyrophosphokinase
MDPNSARPIDLDILIFDKHIIDNEIWTQAHIAIPLAEFIPDFTNPETGETLLEIATRLERKYTLKIRPDVIL